MTISPDSGTTLDVDLLDVLRTATGAHVDFAEPPTPITGGFYARLVRFRLHGATDGWRQELVARVMPDPGTAAKETMVQAGVASQGYPTPAVRLDGGPGDGLGQAFMVMDLAPGAPILAGLDGIAAMSALPRLARALPGLLAESMALLHRLDPGPIRDRLTRSAGSGVGIDQVVASLGETAVLLGRGDLAMAATWLATHRPEAEPDVICHGDLHPFNVLVDTDGSFTVLDWSAALLAPAAYDVAFTGLILAEPPVTVARPFRPLVRIAGRRLARRFRRAYQRRSGAELDRQSLAWHEGLVCLRALLEVAGWADAGLTSERRGHPWLVCGPRFATRLSVLTEVRVRAD